MMKTPGGTRPLFPGVYGPLPTFFDDTQEVDWTSYKAHLLNLADLGIIPVCMGSLGEASHLSPQERIDVIRFVRRSLDEAGLLDRPIVAGVGGASTRETIRLAHDAASAGADAGMVTQYYVDICEASPIPILLYNFPANSAGQDMSSHTIEEIIRRAPNLCGVKLTCPGSISKLIRLRSFIESSPKITASRPFPFLLLDGLISDLQPWMTYGGHGTVSGIPNFAPKAGVRLYNLCQKARQDGLTMEEEREAGRIQSILSRADVAAVPGGVRAMKYALHRRHRYSIAPRRPLLPQGEEDGEAFMNILQPMFDLEDSM